MQNRLHRKLIFLPANQHLLVCCAMNPPVSYLRYPTAQFGVEIGEIGGLASPQSIASLRNGKAAGNDPWDAWTLEWARTSPPPEYNFAILPEVRSSRPLSDLKHPEEP
jgi:heme/copper-type cytochrome/quinol oxidase subunit 1